MKKIATFLFCTAAMFCAPIGNADDMETVAQNLGDLNGKIVIDVSMPFK